MLKIGYKWIRMHAILMKYPEIVPHLPETLLFDEQNLITLLGKHRDLILKASSGTGGKNILKLTSLGSHFYKLQFGNKVLNFKGLDKVIKVIKERELKEVSKSRFIVQQFINLAKINGAPFDVRVMLQRDKDKKWILLCKVARIAAAGKFVTNYHQGGKLSTVAEAINNSTVLNKSLSEAISKDLDRLALLITTKVAPKFKSSLSGIDFGIDNKGKIWFIESNPQPKLDLIYRALAKNGIPFIRI